MDRAVGWGLWEGWEVGSGSSRSWGEEDYFRSREWGLMPAEDDFSGC